MQTFLGLIAVFALVFMNGFFVAAEFSLVGARRTRIAQLAAEGNTGAVSAQYAIEHLDSFIAATQLGITLASLALGWIGEPAIAHLFEPLFHALLPEDMVKSAGHTIGIVIAFIIVTTLHIVLGELAPKSIALQRPEGTSIIVARPTTWFLRIFNPVVVVMNTIGNAVVRLIGFEPAGGHSQVHSAEELEMLVKSSREAGVLQASEEQLLRRVFDFADVQVLEIMQPRVEVDAIAVNIPLPKLLQTITQQHHSRYPVYEESIDKVVGILHLKDLMDMLIARPELVNDPNAAFDLTTLLRKPLFIPGTLTVDKLLENMQKTKTHLAVVADEYGGMAGLITMEDILEQLVGEVQDEFDMEALSITSDGDSSVIDGMVNLSDISERFGEPEGDLIYTTIGGYVVEKLDRIPKVGDTVTYNSYTVQVEEMDGLRVAKVKFIKVLAPVTEEAKDTPAKDGE